MGNILHDVPPEEINLVLFVVSEILTFHARPRSRRSAVGFKLRPLILPDIVAVKIIIPVTLQIDPSKKIALVPDNTHSMPCPWGIVGIATWKNREPPVRRKLLVNFSQLIFLTAFLLLFDVLQDFKQVCILIAALLGGS